MMDEIETQLKDFASDERVKSKVSVADINFALNNGWLIDLLR